MTDIAISPWSLYGYQRVAVICLNSEAPKKLTVDVRILAIRRSFKLSGIALLIHCA